MDDLALIPESSRDPSVQEHVTPLKPGISCLTFSLSRFTASLIFVSIRYALFFPFFHSTETDLVWLSSLSLWPPPYAKPRVSIYFFNSLEFFLLVLHFVPPYNL